ncbi:protein prune homolog 2 isoform X2 [Plodia interpunctella]|uniref:protein prune homolog 2 isoform X2 n=1 Tax=Plodia interpunctella TaxID=58824 RepID=UPI002367C176|nr:protein prune homolog 2 isoform X2 [Plodia interpunctella]
MLRQALEFLRIYNQVNFKTARQTDEEALTSPSSDEKMDTGSESYRSQDTPNSLSDFEECTENILRLNHEVLRLSDPNKKDLNDSLLTKMSKLNIDSPCSKNLGVSPPKFSSTLTLTTNHPLMGLGSPEENYPDVVPKKARKIEEDKDLSLSSIEDERPVETNGVLYSPERNTSKNNLYFTENFVTADSQILESNTPDLSRRKISIEDTPPKRAREGAVVKYIEKKRREAGQSTPKSIPVDVSEKDESHSRVAEWCESPSHLRSMPNFELPIEMSSSIGVHNDLDSPDLLSSSTQEDRSTYEALLDPYTGSVALRPKPQRSPANTRRKIQLPPDDDDRYSVDSVSACSMQSDDLPDLPAVAPPSDDEDTKRSKSTTTLSSYSDPIPEYSAAEELSNERSFLSVPRGGALHTCDVKVIEPYKRVISHGGYDGRGAAVIVFGACHLPDNTRTDYRYVMDNLFLYVIWTLERLVTDEYVLVYLHGSARGRRLPSFHWLHECYKLVDRRLRKSLKHLYLVHPTFWLKSFVLLTKPFVSSKFFHKLSYVRSLEELHRLVPVEPNAIPDVVKQFDANRR